MPSIVAMFDTNILLSGVGWRGNPYRCLERARAGVVEGVTRKELLDELTEKLQARLNFSDAQTIDTIADLLSFLRVVRITNTLKVLSTDPDDDKVLECALVGGATHIVTGDRRHLLPLGNYRGIPIISATNFLTLMSSP